ncbi:enoyl-CoA hydratase/isomerase family protein [Pseudomaricurvus sp.]|uniref:enoyl-CoA hydratase/isomerase family protein n=1 Tax=Pseudomaricurvus sp. TaxID=2004510 RepID=UPI003F6AA8BD
MKDFQFLTYERTGPLAVITLNRPEVRNSLNQGLRWEITAAVQQAGEDQEVKVILLAGNGKGFCAGADLTEKLPGDDQDGFVTQKLRTEYNPMIKSIINAPKPVISVVNGAAAGIGGALAMACDLMVMAEDAFLYSAFGAISLIPDGGTHKFLQTALGSKKAYEMIAFSQRLTAEQCLEAGITNRVVPADQLQEEAKKWASQLAEQAPLTLRLAKEVLHAAASEDLDYCLDKEAVLQNTAIRSEDFVEGTRAFFEKRKPTFNGR